MSVLTKESDLLNFINQKKQSEIDITPKKIIHMYSKIIVSSVSRSLEKLGIYKYTVACCETVVQLFWILFLYSKNLKLTMFLCDRAILLFNEYVIMTKSTLFGNNSLDSVNLSEVKSFVYKKTIGPLYLGDIEFNSNLKKSFIDACKLIGQIYIQVIVKESEFPRSKEKYLIQEKEIEEHLLDIQNCLSGKFLNFGLQDKHIDLQLIGELIETENFQKLNSVACVNSVSLLIHILEDLSICTESQKDMVRQIFNLITDVSFQDHSQKLLKKDDSIIKENVVRKFFN